MNPDSRLHPGPSKPTSNDVRLNRAKRSAAAMTASVSRGSSRLNGATRIDMGSPLETRFQVPATSPSRTTGEL